MTSPRTFAINIEIYTFEFDTLSEAIQHADASSDGRPIVLNGEPLVVSQEDAERLETAGIEFAYLVNHKMKDGTRRIMTVPVND